MTSSPRYLLVKAPRAVLSADDSQVCAASVLVDRETGKIVKVATGTDTVSDIRQDVEEMQLNNDQVLFPGLVDAHGELSMYCRFFRYLELTSVD